MKATIERSIGLFFVLFLFFSFTNQAHAGVISYVFGLFSSENQEVSEDIVFDTNSQTASFLSAPSLSNSSFEEENLSIVDDSAIFPISGPAGTLADVEYLNTANSKIETYTVREGDNLGIIAKMFGVTTNTIAWANDIRGGLIKPSQTLLILPISGVKHKIKSGDTLSKIANEYGGNVDDILRYNNISENEKLVAGEEIIVPDGKIKSTPVVASKTSQSTTQRVSRGLPSYSGYYIKPAINVRRTQASHGYYGAIDFAPLNKTAGTEPILASASGVVTIAKYTGWNGGYGKMVVINHPNGTQTVYGHCHDVFVKEGDSVYQGQVIGTIGNTGKVIPLPTKNNPNGGTHLHFEIRGAINPF